MKFNKKEVCEQWNTVLATQEIRNGVKTNSKQIAENVYVLCGCLR